MVGDLFTGFFINYLNRDAALHLYLFPSIVPYLLFAIPKSAINQILHVPGPTYPDWHCCSNLYLLHWKEDVPICPNFTITLLFAFWIVLIAGGIMGRLTS